jgi:DNA primase
VARIPDETLDAVRQAADLVELVRARVELTRRSGRWWGRCPFHDERSPSFSLLPPDFRRYYCHGCGATGDAISWMQEREGVGSFHEAVEMLAERFGVEFKAEDESPAEAAKRVATQRRLELLERAAAFFEAMLWGSDEAEPARRYLADRGFAEELVRRFRIGWAPAGGAVLAGRAAKEGFSRELMLDAGLARLRGGRAGDFFQSRITFPIADLRGRVQGFGARTLDPAERAKYVNSPEGPAFRKRTLLFGLAQARPDAAKRGWTVVVEGYTDVMGLVAAGIEAAVACMGTSLTADQMRLLARTAPEVRLCFDADAAGEEAAWRTVQAARGVPVRLSAAQLPSGQDPGDLAASEDGRTALRGAIERADPLLTSLISSRARRAGSSPRDRDRALEEITSLLRTLPESVEKDEGVRLAAGLLQLSRVMEDRLREGSRQGEAAAADAPAVASAAPAQEVRERRLLALAIALPRFARTYLDELAAEAFHVDAHREAYSLIVAGDLRLEGWPERLQPLAARLLADTAGLEVTEAELREAVYRLQLPMVERRAAERREAGDERGRLEALGLARRLRAALRGEA